jgi:hypothetical protein
MSALPSFTQSFKYTFLIQLLPEYATKIIQMSPTQLTINIDHTNDNKLSDDLIHINFHITSTLQGLT